MSTTTIDEKGRVTIPKELRDQLGLEAGSKIVFAVINNSLLLRKTITVSEFEHISDKITQQLAEQTEAKLELDKLF